MQWIVRPMLVAAALALAGCDSTPEKVKTHPVSGQVFYDGKPAAGVKVYFVPTSAPTVPLIPMNPHGVSGDDGRFAVGTFGPTDGAAEGGYQIVLSWPAEMKDGEEESEDRLLGWYTAVYSKLTAQVKSGENALPPFQLPARKTKPADVQGIPRKN